MLPSIGHAVVVGVELKWTGEVLRTPGVGDLILLDVVQSVLVCVAVGVGCVGGIEEAVARVIEAVAVLEAVGHTVAIGVPVPGPVEATVIVHVLLKPSPVTVTAHEIGVRCLEIQSAEDRDAAVDTQLDLSVGNLVSVGDEVTVAVLFERIGIVPLLDVVAQAVGLWLLEVQQCVARVAELATHLLPLARANVLLNQALCLGGQQIAVPVAVKRVE